MTHEHEHTHDGDASHNHHRLVVAGGMPLGPLSWIGAAHEHPDDHEHDMVALVASSMARLGSSWGVAQTGDNEFAVLAADGSVQWSANSYAEAVGRIAAQMATRADTAVLSDTWRSDMAFEGRPTGDGRFIRPGAIEYRDTPLPLMLQTETAGGHMGAVLAGTIVKTGMLGTTAIGSGTFDDSDAGRQFVDIIAARGKFGVSIDVAEAEGEYVCLETDDAGDCTKGQVEFSLLRVMGLTGTPFPAFEDAFIENDATAAAAEPIAAAGEPECVECLEEQVSEGTGVPMTPVEVPLGETGVLVAASVGLEAPPLAWFQDPEFNESMPSSDPRLIRQPNGTFGCPLTITDEGQVYGHVALHKSCHTGYANECVPPPRSRTGYAAFMLRPLMTAEGEVIHVGHLTAGAGHADDNPRTPLSEVRAHYDGAPGAVQLASIRVGEDKFGIWFAGAVKPGVTAEQVERARQMSVSGDWRNVWTGKGLDMVAVAAGVTVPGFPIAAMAAAGFVPVETGASLGPARTRFLDGQPMVLVAAGVVRQPLPWERMIAAQQGQIDQLRGRVEAAERVTSQLRALAAERIRADMIPA